MRPVSRGLSFTGDTMDSGDFNKFEKSMTKLMWGYLIVGSLLVIGVLGGTGWLIIWIVNKFTEC